MFMDIVYDLDASCRSCKKQGPVSISILIVTLCYKLCTSALLSRGSFRAHIAACKNLNTYLQVFVLLQHEKQSSTNAGRV